MSSINVMKHGFVPEHRLVPEDKEDEVLEETGAKRDKLPKIRKSDPVIQHMERKHGDIDVGRIIKVKRDSKTAGVAVAYRLVISR